LNIILEQIKADSHNIQEIINLIPFAESKGEYRSLIATIKILHKEIIKQKSLLTNKLYNSPKKYSIPLFEVDIPEPEIDYSGLNSFFGNIDD